MKVSSGSKQASPPGGSSITRTPPNENTFHEFLYDGWDPWKGSDNERLFREVSDLVGQ